MNPRFLPLLRADGAYVDFAPLALSGVMHYPNCELSAEHYRHVLGEDEEKRPGEWSTVGKLIHTDTIKRKTQGHIAGRVALQLIEMSAHGPDPSVNKAVFIVRQQAKEETTNRKPLKPASESGIRTAFYDFRDVVHFWAAQVAFSREFVDAGASLDALKAFVSIASAFEVRLDQIISNSPGNVSWNPWRVPNALRDEIQIKIPPRSEAVRALIKDYHPALR